MEVLSFNNLHKIQLPSPTPPVIPNVKIPTWVWLFIGVLILGGGGLAYLLYKKSKDNEVLANTNDTLVKEKENLKGKSFVEIITNGIKNA